MGFATLAGLSQHWAERRPDQPAMIEGDARLDWAAFHARVLRAAAALAAAGVGPGDRIGHLGLNSIAFAVLLQAALRLGAVLTPISWRLAPAEVAFVAGDAGVRWLLADRGFAPLVAPLAAPLVAGAVRADGIGLVWTEDFAGWIAADAPPAPAHAARPGDVALQMYTSGTTGFPKGALLTHANLLATIGGGARTGEDWAQWAPADVALVAMPLFHIGGTGWLLHAMEAGAASVILPRPDVAAMVEAIAKQRITRMFAVPAVLNMILQHPDTAAADLGSMSVLLYGASPIPLDVLKGAMRAFPNARFVQCYGATETAGTVVYLPPADHDPAGNERMRGCGRPFPGNAIRVLDASGQPLPPRAVGEIAVRSASVMAGYHGCPEASAAAIVDGWYRTGDAGWMDEDGYLYIHDRERDMIISGGENIYPAEVENALFAHPGVADAAVIGVPDATWGEAVKAIVVRRPGVAVTAAALIDHCRAHIAGFKCPKSVDFVDALPRNAGGKVLKTELRKPYWPQDVRQVG